MGTAEHDSKLSLPGVFGLMFLYFALFLGPKWGAFFSLSLLVLYEDFFFLFFLGFALGHFKLFPCIILLII